MFQLIGLKDYLLTFVLALSVPNAIMNARAISQISAVAELPSMIADLTSPPHTNPIKRYPLDLRDRVVSDSDFFLFRDRLRQAIRDRDAKFIRAISDPKIRLLEADRPTRLTFDDLQIDDPNAEFWANIEKAMAIGCAENTNYWICPNVFLVLHDNYAVAIVGENISVYEHPNAQSAVIAALSNEAVKKTPLTDKNSYLREERKNGWIGITLSNGRSGFVRSRYAYSELGYRASFEKFEGEWKMVSFLVGD
ncbi:SH3 domain-containing protein [Tumidithrix elongata RA019]|uniref:SH3 domain-containing protein n=1 Tax=Tumidithrix elongata BACA0141 TaxID=2716417 RepID=A0AAW9PXZ7_9CYAN|nr:SH3 domain-containing protein [Tumidithrix elongata RA019]